MKTIRLRTCKACGKEYEYCNTCSEFKLQPSWKNIFCEKDCKDVFMTVTDYKAGEITAEEAYDILEPINSYKFMDHPHITAVYEELNLK